MVSECIMSHASSLGLASNRWFVWRVSVVCVCFGFSHSTFSFINESFMNCMVRRYTENWLLAKCFGQGSLGMYFLLFPQCILPIPKDFFKVMFILQFAKAFKLDQYKMLSSGKEKEIVFRKARKHLKENTVYHYIFLPPLMFSSISNRIW